ncbi:hypothetical protein DM01DRAFT_1331200 [Hesseltinella vesiculosa]|uniref:Uncharacterized protein n=1 Tax=Hesseltinella vesiculosa TaxID=101127 RepID=A0A1X2GYG6_9FUNG|nr:hypothetical protein DM01DRAFT_1331200 [Hesseltinella vesiculosa]
MSLVQLFFGMPAPPVAMATLPVMTSLDSSLVLVHRPNQRADPWTLYDWLQDLPRLSLYHLFMDMLPPTKAALPTASPPRPRLNHPAASISLERPLSPTILTQVKQVIMIQQHASALIGQHPSHTGLTLSSKEQAQLQVITVSLKQLTRLASQWLRSHSALALLALVAILDQVLEKSSVGLRRYALDRAKLGRTVVLEMSAVLKTFDLPHRRPWMTYQQGEQQALVRWADYLVACLDPPTLHHDKHWILAWLIRVCQGAATHDLRWQFKQEYDQVIVLAKQCL